MSCTLKTKSRLGPRLVTTRNLSLEPGKRIIQKGNETAEQDKACELKTQGAKHGAPVLRREEWQKKLGSE